jgi:hypothetical protein
VLTADLTTLPRRDTPIEVLSHLGVVDGTSVSIPWLDSRTATVPDISMHNDKIAPLMDRRSGATRRSGWRSASATWCPSSGIKQIAFFGVVHAPDFDYETERSRSTRKTRRCGWRKPSS